MDFSPITDWLSSFSKWIGELKTWIFSIPSRVRDLIEFIFNYLSKFFDYVIYSILKPIIKFLSELEFPCSECIDTLNYSIDYLLSLDLTGSLGFDVVCFMTYILDFLNLKYAVNVFVTVLFFRFLLRRIPFIG